MNHTKLASLLLSSVLVVAALFSAGCGTVNHSSNLTLGYSMKPETKIVLGLVEDKTAEKYDVDICALMGKALQGRLKQSAFSGTSSTPSNLTLRTRILEYEKGSAFNRWLMPGMGQTFLKIQCDLMDGENVVGTIRARRTVDVGGVLSIGAWESIFQDVAGDVMEELKKLTAKRAP